MRRLAALLLLVPAIAAARLPQPVSAALSRAQVPASAVSVVVAPADPGTPLVTHNALAPMNPASVMKLLTAYAALDILGPAFTFRTEALATADVANGVLEGDLYLKGGGDPRLTYERLWQFARELRARGIREIRGDVVMDRSYFAAAPHDSGRFDQDPRRAYNVGADALLANFQVIDFRIVPTTNGVRVVPVPDLPSIEVASRIEPTREPCGHWRQALTHEVIPNGLLATVVFSGRYAVDCGEKSWPLSVLEGPRYTEALWRWLWSEAGGVLRGQVRAGTAPAEARLLHRMDSDPLSVLVRDMNKFSNNVVARHLYLAISAEKTKAPGDVKASEALLRAWLRARDLQMPELVIENGSGLSRNERLSAASVAGLLRSAWQSALMPEIVASMPVYGVDGTMKSRSGAGVGRAHMKSGGLSGVQSGAGFVLDRRGRRWIVVMIVNHANAGATQPAMDALLEWVVAR
jgi:D-alanyl-D-alanine carboxypeptidase/D-alanyl-D-alanine-endopeptidase (penicillin-binding protein 4)